MVASVVGGRHIDFRYNATSGDIVDNTVEQLNLANMRIAVGTLFLRQVELEICLGVNFTPPPGTLNRLLKIAHLRLRTVHVNVCAYHYAQCTEHSTEQF